MADEKQKVELPPADKPIVPQGTLAQPQVSTPPTPVKCPHCGYQFSVPVKK